jgi:Uma2 family endonuclease
VLGSLAKVGDLGQYMTDGMRLSNVAADLSTEPDGMFVALSTWESGRARLVEGKEEGFVEVEGTPDTVLEILSAYSEEKDLVVLRELYGRAEIPEFWLFDVRAERLSFDILRRGSKGYTATRKRDGWVKSAVFGKSFKLTRGVNKLGHPTFTLSVQ